MIFRFLCGLRMVNKAVIRNSQRIKGTFQTNILIGGINCANVLVFNQKSKHSILCGYNRGLLIQFSGDSSFEGIPYSGRGICFQIIGQILNATLCIMNIVI